MSFKPIDPKRDEYRRYLERVGLVESLTKVFVRILRIRPDNPIEYMLDNLGEARLQNDKLADLEEELENSHQEIQRLRAIISNINPDLLQLPAGNNEQSDNRTESNLSTDLNSVGNKFMTPPVATSGPQINLENPGEQTNLERGDLNDTEVDTAANGVGTQAHSMVSVKAEIASATVLDNN